ncbi:YuiB family protein [Salirhabdus salicampi]|uniref:YuiB family protein n=1 Tax=Salirhabdus salicampi TaxID=476102 RepID=UPI003F5A6D86
MLHLFVGTILYFVLFFGIAFLLNMLLRQTWIMAFFYPIIVIGIVDNFPFGKYFTDPGWAFPELWLQVVRLELLDIVFLTAGFVGTIVSGIVIKTLRANGYQMF